MKHCKRLSAERPLAAPCRAAAWDEFLNAVYRDTVDFVWQKILLFVPMLEDF